MKTLFCLALTFSISTGFAQYFMFQSELSCKPDKNGLVSKGHELVKSVLSAMAREGKLLNFEATQAMDKDKTTLSYAVTVKSDSIFKQINEEWKKRTAAADPALFKAFWQACPVRKDTLVAENKWYYPCIKGNINCPVAMTADIDERPDSTITYSMVIDFESFAKVDGNNWEMDPSAENWGLHVIGRIINLHIADGIPQDKINFIAAVHGNAVYSFLNKEAYQKEYKTDNPNLPLIEELSNAGVKFLLCGQTLSRLGISRSMLSTKAGITLASQTTLSLYQLKGYALKVISNK